MKLSEWKRVLACQAAGILLAAGMAQVFSAETTSTEETDPHLYFAGETEEAPAGENDPHLYFAGETEEAPAEETESLTEAETGEEVKVSRIRFAKDYGEIFSALKKADERWYRYGILSDDVIDFAYEETAIASDFDAGSAKPAAPASASSQADSTDYSATNVRTEGVDEADIVKTDGSYIYILKRLENELIILKADGAGTGIVSRTSLFFPGGKGWYYSEPAELLLGEDRVYVILEGRTDLSETEPDYPSWYYNSDRESETGLLTYDISDPSDPQLTDSLLMSGAYRQARQKDGFLYLFSECIPCLGESAEESSLKVHAGGEEIPPNRFILPSLLTAPKYLVTAAVSEADPGRAADSTVVVSGSDQLYVSENGIYVLNVDDWSDRTRTEITKVRYDGGVLTGVAAGTVRGTVDDTFSIDEYNGCLRVLTTYMGRLQRTLGEILGDLFGFDYYDSDRWTWHNALYILDEDLNRVGILSDLAPGEQVKSARYFGDTAYFVTFRNTDPLFAADLSDPAHPAILGELTLPGFSAYLHPFGDGKLLGLGYDADELTGSRSGIKLSLFDISDPAAAEECARRIIPGITWCPAIEEYKAIFADASRGITGFWCDGRYMVFSPADDGSFSRVLLYDFYEDDLQEDSDYDSMRGLYIGSDFYLAGSSFVLVFDMDRDFAKTAVIHID